VVSFIGGENQSGVPEKTSDLTITSCRLAHRDTGKFPGGPQSDGPSL